MALQLKVVLEGSKPLIWRQLLISEGISLAGLHAILQGAFGWQDMHLYEFRINNVDYVPADMEAANPDMSFDTHHQKLVPALGKTKNFHYLYDFGDRWRHSIQVEPISHEVPLVFFGGFCIAGENAGPPEDVGGIDGYEQYCKALKDKSDPDHSSMVSWRGPFNPEAFNPQQSTLLIQTIFARNLVMNS